MRLLNDHHSFTGIQRDMSVSKQPSSFLYDAHNIRLTARGEDTLITLTNEKGPEYKNIQIQGTYLGHCLLEKFLVVFSTNSGNEKPDYITRINLDTIDESSSCVILYNGNLKFSVNYPIETIASYENSEIQKVYWTDGLNQPRLINIVGNISQENDTQFDFVQELKLNEEVTIKKQLGAAGSFSPGVIQYALTYFNKYGQESNIFYTSPLLYISYKERGASPEDKVENAFNISVRNLDSNFDYIRIYSIQRTSLNGTPIVRRVQDINIKSSTVQGSTMNYNISNTKPTVLINNYKDYSDEYSVSTTKDILNAPNGITWYGYKKSDYPTLVIKTDSGFITWGNNSTDNSYLWVSDPYNGISAGLKVYGYRICETPSIDSNTLENILYSSSEILLDGISFLDTGTAGEILGDPTELLYKGGESIIAGSIEHKDGTLFLGDITLMRQPLNNVIKDRIKNGVTIEQSTRIFYPKVVSNSGYVYANQLTSYDSTDEDNSVPCGGFKKGDYYRCGLQFQYKDGKWSDPIWKGDVQVTNIPTEVGDFGIKIPTLKGILSAEESREAYNLGYRKVRAVVVYPEIQDRVTICQGVLCPTVYTQNQRKNGSSYAQSSWFFRPLCGSSVTEIDGDGTVTPAFKDEIPYTSNEQTKVIIGGFDIPAFPSWNPEKIRQVEVQGHFDPNYRFKVGTTPATLHSPDIEFDDHLMSLDYINSYIRIVGSVNFTFTMSDIDIQTSSPTISNGGAGFTHLSFSKKSSHGIVSGLFYDDYLVDDNQGVYEAYNLERNTVRWMVYPWSKNGSLNNDIQRPTDKGARTAELKKKVISNLRFTETWLGEPIASIPISGTPQIFNSDQLSIVKLGDNIYQGNIDTLLSPSGLEGMYFAFDSKDDDTIKTNKEVKTEFNSTNWWKTFCNFNSAVVSNAGTYKYIYEGQNKGLWRRVDKSIGDKNQSLTTNRESVRMRYKSTPHMVLSTDINNIIIAPSDKSVLAIAEIIRKGYDESSSRPNYRDTMFGGTSEDALKANIWIPCGEPVKLTGEQVEFNYSYGDTYFQRWDCLKTYPFSNEDTNQIVEIGSFMLETRTNIDGRYDRNRGQHSNINMSPQNFNLLNTVYSQINNFFSYRILDDSYYNINSFPNQITWSKEKQSGADIDMWTNITLASTYDMDGSKGKIVALRKWKDNIFCFQDKGISNILFNSRVQIPTSDGVPIEISNSYKVDGYRYLSDGIGCTNKHSISITPSGLYFIDSVSRHLFSLGDGIQDVSTTHNITSWFNNEDNIVKTLYDSVNHDLYVLTDSTALCYSEVLGQFTSFMDYNGIDLIENRNNAVYTLKDGKFYKMFSGEYNNFFGEQKGWDFTFISNGIDSNTMDFDKVFSTIDYRMDVFDANEYSADKSFNYIQVTDEYQDTGEVLLTRLKSIDNNKSYHHSNANMQKKFRIWRIQIPRNKNSLDRIRNPWCKIKLGNYGEDNCGAVLHDLNVQYFI